MNLEKKRFLHNPQLDEVDFYNVDDYNWTKEHVYMLLGHLKAWDVKFNCWENMFSNHYLIEYNNVFYRCTKAIDVIKIFIAELINIRRMLKFNYYHKGEEKKCF